MGSIKIISFAVTLVADPRGEGKQDIQKIEYPELQKLLANGWELIDTLPAWGAGNQFVITFQLEKKPKRRKRTQ